MDLIIALFLVNIKVSYGESTSVSVNRLSDNLLPNWGIVYSSVCLVFFERSAT